MIISLLVKCSDYITFFYLKAVGAQQFHTVVWGWPIKYDIHKRMIILPTSNAPTHHCLNYVRLAWEWCGEDGTLTIIVLVSLTRYLMVRNHSSSLLETTWAPCIKILDDWINMITLPGFWVVSWLHSSYVHLVLMKFLFIFIITF